MKIKSLISVVISTALITGVATVPSNALGTPKTQQKISWGWEDGGDKGHRDFSEDDYDTLGEMPSVEVTILPAKVGRRVILERFSPITKTWSAEQVTRTSGDGVALLQVNPICDEEEAYVASWCDTDVTYRIRVLKSGTQRQSLSRPFVVTFVTSEIDTF
jgi:hypothetical protein